MAEPGREELRTQAKARRAALTDRAEQNTAVAAALAVLPEWQSAQCVFAYIAVRDEVDVNPLLRELLATGAKRICVPRVAGEGLMDAVMLTAWEELTPGLHGLLQPPAHCPPLAAQQIDLVLVPGLLFARDGSRLGYGGGYYDRYLAHLPGVMRIGLSYRELLVERLPAADGEPRCDLVLTADGALRCFHV